jgi:hypothetical protein
MAVLSYLWSLLTGADQESGAKDLRKRECPYCGGALAKILGRKTRCPSCGEFMFVRTRPKDKARLVVTALEAERIEEEWAIQSGMHDVYLAKKEAVAAEHDELKKRFGGREPSTSDVEWGLLNKELLQHIKNQDWGFYRNTRLHMAEILRKENRLKEAAEIYCEVCYLDLNGANNLGGFKRDLELLKEFPSFDPEMGFLAPGVIGLLENVAVKSSIDHEELKLMFICRSAKLQNSLKTPLEPEACWFELWKKL